MALVGGGGAGNVTGSNPSGIGSTINYIGEHVYASSGIITIDNTETNLLKFTIASSQYVVATFYFNMIQAQGEQYLYKIYVNEQVINGYNAPGGSDTVTAADNPIKVLLAPNDEVRATAQNSQSTAARDQIVSMVGRVY